MNKEKAAKAVKALQRKDPAVRLPDDGELERMFRNAARIGGFKTEGYEKSHYQSSSGVIKNARHGGAAKKQDEHGAYSVRLVRTR